MASRNAKISEKSHQAASESNPCMPRMTNQSIMTAAIEVTEALMRKDPDLNFIDIV